MKIKSTRRGFTLIELLVVVVIIGILAAVAVPQYQKAVLKSHYAKLKTLTNSIAQAQEIYYLEYGQYSSRFNALNLETPPFKNQTTNDNENKRYFDWGSCWIVAGEDNDPRTACKHDKSGLIYYIHLKHSNSTNAGKRRCQGGNADENSIQNRLCKAETGAQTGHVSESVIYWVYQ